MVPSTGVLSHDNILLTLGSKEGHEVKSAISGNTIKIKNKYNINSRLLFSSPNASPLSENFQDVCVIVPHRLSVYTGEGWFLIL